MLKIGNAISKGLRYHGLAGPSDNLLGPKPFSICSPLISQQEDTLCLSAAANAPKNAGECRDPLGSGGICQVKGVNQISKHCIQVRKLWILTSFSMASVQIALILGRSNVACFGQI